MAYNLGTAHGEITIGYDDNGVLRARNSMGQFVSTAALMGNSIDDVDRRGNILTRTLSSVTSVLRLVGKWAVAGSVGLVGLGQAIGVVVAAAAQLEPVLVSALSFLPGIILSAVAAFAVLKIAVIGVSDAIKAGLSGDTEKFAEALKKLAPNAASFATAVRDAASSLRPLQQAMQNELFTGFATGTAAAGRNLQLLGPQASNVAVEFNRIGQEILKFASGSTFIAGLNGALEAVRVVLMNLRGAITPLLEGFFSLAAQIPVFAQPFGAGIAGFLKNLGESMKNINLAQTFQSARDALAPFINLFQNLGGIALAFFQAFSAGGADTLGIIGELAEKLNTFLSSDAGTAALMALGQAMQAIAGAAGQALLALLQAIAPSLVTLAPAVTALAQLVGGTLAQAFAALAPTLTVLVSALTGALLPIFMALEPAISSLIGALGPLIALIGGALASVITAVAPALAILAQIIGQVLSQAINALMPALTPLLAVFTQLVNAILPPLMPLLTVLGQLLGAVLSAVAPLIAVFAGLLAPVLTVVATVIGVVVGWLAQLITWIVQAITWVVQIVAAFIKWAVIRENVVELFNTIRNVITTVMGYIGQYIGQKVAEVKQTFQNISAIIGIVGNIFSNMVNTIRDRINSAWNVIREFPGRVTSAIGNLGGLLVSAGRDLIQGLINGIQNMAGSVIQKARDIANQVSSTIKGALGIGSPSKIMIQYGEWTSEGLAIGIENMIGAVTRAASEAAQAALAVMPNNFTGTVNQVLAASTLGAGTGTGITPVPVGQVTNNGATIITNVTAPQNMDPNDVGNAVAARVVLKLQTAGG